MQNCTLQELEALVVARREKERIEAEELKAFGQSVAAERDEEQKLLANQLLVKTGVVSTAGYTEDNDDGVGNDDEPHDEPQDEYPMGQPDEEEEDDNLYMPVTNPTYPTNSNRKPPACPATPPGNNSEDWAALDAKVNAIIYPGALGVAPAPACPIALSTPERPAKSYGPVVASRVMAFASPGSGSVVEDEEMAPVPMSMQKVATVANEGGGGNDSSDDGGYDSPPEEEGQGSEKEEEDVAVINRNEEDDDNSMTSEARKYICVGTHLGRKGILQAMPRVKGSSLVGNALFAGFDLLMGKYFWRGLTLGRLGVDQ
jgi:hypothetical protein